MLARMKRARGAIAAPALLLLATAAYAQSGPLLRQPIVGYVHDLQAGALRPLAGVPGSVVLESRFDLAADLTRIYLPPAAGWALVEAKSSGRLELAEWADSQPRFRQIGGDEAPPDRVVFSASGGSAALYWEAGSRLQVWTGFPAAPARLGELTLPSPVRSFALSDDGAALAVASEDSIQLFSEGWQRVLVTGAGFGALAFRPQSHDLAVAGGEDSGIRLFSDATGSAQETTFVSPEQGAKQVTALAFAGDGRWLVFLNKDESAVRVADAGVGDAAALWCPSIPETLRAAGQDGPFLLSNAAKGHVLLLDFDTGAPRLSGAAAEGLPDAAAEGSPGAATKAAAGGQQ